MLEYKIIVTGSMINLNNILLVNVYEKRRKELCEKEIVYIEKENDRE